MKLSDLTVEVRDKDRKRIGMIRPEELDLTVSDKHNNVGAWSLKLPMEHPLANALRTPGSGIVVSRTHDTYGQVYDGPKPYSEVVLADEPVGYWRLGEAGGSVSDSSGNGMDGTWIGTPGQTTTAVTDGAASSLDGASSHATLPMVQDAVEAASIEGWIRLSHADPDVVFSSRGSGAGSSLTVGVNHSYYTNSFPGAVAFGLDSDGTYIGVRTPTTVGINDGQWHHVVCVWTGQGADLEVLPSQFHIYVDGAEISGLSATDIGSATAPLTGLSESLLGYHAPWNLRYTGDVDEFAFYRRSLDASEILEHYEAGKGLIPTYRYDVTGQVTEPLFSGPVITPAFQANSEDPTGSLTIAGVTDTVALADALAWPQPSNPDPTTQTASHDVRTGAAETVMHAYVNANIGPGAPVARQKAGLVLGTDGQRGPSLTKRARFPVLGNLLHECAVISDLGFRVVQRSSDLVFETFPVSDRTKTIRLDVLNGTLASQAVAVSAPGATRVIVAGQGDLVERQFVARDNAESIQAETDWGRRIERFVDQRQTDVIAELEQAGDELLAEEGFTAVSVKAVPMDDTTMVFGKDWGLGDRVTVVVDGAESTAIVTGYVLRVSSEGVRIGATLGDVTDFDTPARLSKRVEDTARRVSELERNSSARQFIYGPPDSAGPGYRTVMVPN